MAKQMLKNFIIGFVLIVTVVLVGSFYYKNQAKEEKIYNVMDQVILTLDSQLKLHEMDDLKTAMLLSKNEGIVNALENDDEDLGYKILADITSSIEKTTSISIRAQIITKELNIFARSWDSIYAGMPLGDYRTDLEYFKTHKTPRASIEIGRRLGIKATVQIYKNEIFLGFVEVISFFKPTTDFFASIGVDLYVLLDTKYIDTAVLMVNNVAIQNYVVSNLNYNYNHIQTLGNIDFKELKLSKVVHMDDKYVFYKTMYDGASLPIGAFVLVLPQKYLDYFRKPEDDISYLINVTRSTLYDIIKKDKYAANAYDDYKASSMSYLKDVVSYEDKQLFLEESYKKLDKQSKDELIQMVLERRIVKKIDGKIR